jgi:hypothetical protein
MKNKNEDIRKFVDNLPDKYDILEEGIDVQTQIEYINYSHSFEQGELSESATINLGDILFDTKTEIEIKKKVLTLLAHLGTITAFRQIEKYYNNCDNTIKQWAALALQECKMFLVSELTDQNTGFISSGLGGLHQMLRYYILILPFTDKQFTTAQKKVIQKELIIVSKELNCIVESFDISDTFAGIIALVPFDVAVGTFIEKGINKCNELGEFVYEHYYVTNQNIPDKAEISEIIKIVKDE